MNALCLLIVLLLVAVGASGEACSPGTCCDVSSACASDFNPPPDFTDPTSMSHCPYPSCPPGWRLSTSGGSWLCAEPTGDRRTIAEFASLWDCKFRAIPGRYVPRGFCMQPFQEAYDRCLAESGMQG